MTNTQRAVAYVRISADKEGTGEGVERQERILRELAAKQGYTLTEVITDNDISAYKGKQRPGFARLNKLVRSGAVEIVMVREASRLTRRTREHLDFYELCAAHKVRVSIGGTEYDSQDLAEDPGALITAWSTQRESKLIGERVKLAHLDRLRSGGFLGGPRSFGHRLVDGHLVVVDDEAKVVRSLVRRFLAGETISALARDLNAKGITTVNGTKWSPDKLRIMLSGPRLAGLISYEGTKHQGTHKAIISRAQHDAICAVLDARKLGPRERRITKHPLSGWLRCGLCGTTMFASTSEGKRRYACMDNQCRKVAVFMHVAEAELIRYLREYLDSEAFASALSQARSSKGTHTITDAASELSATRERLTLLEHDFYVEGKMSAQRYEGLARELGTRITELEGELVRLTGTQTATLEPKALLRALENASPDSLRKLLTLLIDSIDVHPRRVGSTARLTVKWRQLA